MNTAKVEGTTKNKVHTVYKTHNGQRVPSVTTALGILNKPALIDWAWNLGTQGIDYKAVRDNAGDIGTLAHYLIMCHLKSETPDTSEYSVQDIDKAETCLIKYFDWEKDNPVKPIGVELPLVSEVYGYGGTIDCLAKDSHGDLILIDHKTGKAIYPCEICEGNASEGQVSIDHVFSSGHDRPPFHPSCRCALIPVMLNK